METLSRLSDKFIIHSRDIEYDIENADAIVGTLQKAGVSLSVKKCSFSTKTVK